LADADGLELGDLELDHDIPQLRDAEEQQVDT